LKNGALVVDVRSAGEFRDRHLPEATNVPVEQVEKLMPKVESDRSRVLLVHCQSGMRSRVAESKLKAMGYSKVFNLGSYGRAQSIVTSKS
jgi:rhodanese-related sulfurtransferase